MLLVFVIALIGEAVICGVPRLVDGLLGDPERGGLSRLLDVFRYLPLIVGWLLLGNVALGLVLGFMFRTARALLPVGVAVALVPLGIGVVDAGALDSRASEHWLSLFVTLFVPVSLGYGVGAWVARWASGGLPR